VEGWRLSAVVLVLAGSLSGKKTILSPNEGARGGFDADGDEMSSDTSVTSVQIFGQEYKIRGFEDKSYVERVAGYVDEKMKELARNSSSLPQERLAVLAALNIADELLQETRRSTETLLSIERRTDEMIARLDGCLLSER
jgi:cell division protein ZapA (FtsZ GTPase activity inhibitor)